MATAVPTNPDLECTICMDMFKIPKMLSCGHSFCRDCLERYIDDRNRTFPCPLCKQDIKIPRGGVDKFPTNFSLKTLTDSTILKPKHYCPDHCKKEVECYCQTCNLGLCSKCILKDHKDHKYLDLELDSSREHVVQILSKHEQFLKNQVEKLEQTHATLLETSEKLKFLCDKACVQISEKTEKIIGELKENCEKRQNEIRDHFDKNELQLTETRQKVVTQIENIKTGLDTAHPSTEKPTLTLIYSLTKLQELQILCENMKTDIPPVTYVEWREGNVKVCDILGSTVKIPLNETSNVFKFNYKDIKEDGVRYFSEDRCTIHGVVWKCGVWRCSNTRCIDIRLLLEYSQRVRSCGINYTLTLLNKDKNVISKTRTGRFSTDYSYMSGEIEIPWNKLTDPSEGFIDNQGQFLVRLDILDVLYRKYKSWFEW